jgi:phenylacetate-coenzyme A ligase PaaK-like adenylate-forming protein
VTDSRLRCDELLEHLTEIDDDVLYLDEFRVMTSSGSSGRKSVFVYDRSAWRGILTQLLRRSDWTGPSHVCRVCAWR